MLFSEYAAQLQVTKQGADEEKEEEEEEEKEKEEKEKEEKEEEKKEEKRKKMAWEETEGGTVVEEVAEKRMVEMVEEFSPGFVLPNYAKVAKATWQNSQHKKIKNEYQAIGKTHQKPYPTSKFLHTDTDKYWCIKTNAPFFVEYKSSEELVNLAS